MTLVEELMPVVDRLGDDSYREGYLQALADTDVFRDGEPVPQGYDRLLEQRLLERRERLNHQTGAAA